MLINQLPTDPEKNNFLFLLCLCSFYSFAQNKITLNGKILKENLQSPIESATVYIINPKDSAVVEYTISDKEGLFQLQIKPSAQTLILKIAAEGYEEYSKNFEKLIANKNFGNLKLTELNSLNEVVVKTTAPPVRVKKDT